MIKISGNKVMSIDDSDVSGCYLDIWKTAKERENAHYQGDWPIGWPKYAGNKDETKTEDKAVTDAYGNQFYNPLDFELLETHMPFYQMALGDCLEYELNFNAYSHLVVVTGDAGASYVVEKICLEFDMLPQPELARQIRNQYTGRLTILYDPVLCHRKIAKNKADPLWNIKLDVSVGCMKGILMLFEDTLSAIIAYMYRGVCWNDWT